MPTVLFRIHLDPRAAQSGLLGLPLCLYTLACGFLYLPFTVCLPLCLPITGMLQLPDMSCGVMTNLLSGRQYEI